MILLVRILSAPLIALGFVWQFLAGSFYAGRIASTGWIHRLAKPKTPAADQKDSTPASARLGGLH